MGKAGQTCGANLLLAALLSLSGLVPGAAEGVARRMVSDAEAARWRAVGTLNVAGHRACTAALISDHEAITAAHCVYNLATRLRTDPAAFQLVLGQRGDYHAAVRGVRATAFLPGYATGPKTGFATMSVDVALLELDVPVSPDEAVPLEVVDWPTPIGYFVDIVGYERGGPDAATIREGCTAIDSAEGVTAVTCDVVSGLSGAPVLLRENPDDSPRLVATVSSRDTGGGAGLAYVVSIVPLLAELRAQITN